MEDRDDIRRLPPDLEEVGEALRSSRVEVTALELDRIKQRAKARALSRRGVAVLRNVRRVVVTGILVLGLAVSGSGVVIATKGGGGSKGKGAGQAQYKPGKGCGDKNKAHEREKECKKPPK
jgi:hypothetical protein